MDARLWAHRLIARQRDQARARHTAFKEAKSPTDSTKSPSSKDSSCDESPEHGQDLAQLSRLGERVEYLERLVGVQAAELEAKFLVEREACNAQLLKQEQELETLRRKVLFLEVKSGIEDEEDAGALHELEGRIKEEMQAKVKVLFNAFESVDSKLDNAFQSLDEKLDADAKELEQVAATMEYVLQQQSKKERRCLGHIVRLQAKMGYLHPTPASDEDDEGSEIEMDSPLPSPSPTCSLHEEASESASVSEKTEEAEEDQFNQFNQFDQFDQFDSQRADEEIPKSSGDESEPSKVEPSRQERQSYRMEALARLFSEGAQVPEAEVAAEEREEPAAPEEPQTVLCRAALVALEMKLAQERIADLKDPTYSRAIYPRFGYAKALESGEDLV